MQSEKVITDQQRPREGLLAVYEKGQTLKVVDYTEASDGDMLAKHHELTRAGWELKNRDRLPRR